MDLTTFSFYRDNAERAWNEMGDALRQLETDDLRTLSEQTSGSTFEDALIDWVDSELEERVLMEEMEEVS